MKKNYFKKSLTKNKKTNKNKNKKLFKKTNKKYNKYGGNLHPIVQQFSGNHKYNKDTQDITLFYKGQEIEEYIGRLILQYKKNIHLSKKDIIQDFYNFIEINNDAYDEYIQ